jgi:hypothetical protein
LNVVKCESNDGSLMQMKCKKINFYFSQNSLSSEKNLEKQIVWGWGGATRSRGGGDRLTYKSAGILFYSIIHYSENAHLIIIGYSNEEAVPSLLF